MTDDEERVLAPLFNPSSMQDGGSEHVMLCLTNEEWAEIKRRFGPKEWFTVVGFYNESLDTFIEHVEARSATDADEYVRRMRNPGGGDGNHSDGNVTICAVFRGKIRDEPQE